jgi:hypothetical protein
MRLSEGASDVWDQIRKAYVATGFGPHRAWYFLLPGDSADVRELEALGYIETRVVGRSHFGLTDFGLSELMDQTEMSNEALNLQRQVAKEYVQAKFPPYQSWILNPAPGVNELVARGFLENFAMGGHTRLTSYGQHWIMQNRDV